MKLRQKNKRDQALDAVASVAKTWSEWQLGKRATKTVAKKASKVKDSGKATRLKIAGAVALVGGIGTAVAKKFMGGGQAEPLSDPPGPAPDMESPPATPIVVEDLTDEAPAESAPGYAAGPNDPDAAAEPGATADDADVAAPADEPADKTS